MGRPRARCATQRRGGRARAPLFGGWGAKRGGGGGVQAAHETPAPLRLPCGFRVALERAAPVRFPCGSGGFRYNSSRFFGFFHSFFDLFRASLVFLQLRFLWPARHV